MSLVRNSILISIAMVAAQGAAFAQDDTGMGGGGTGDATGGMGETTTPTTTTAAGEGYAGLHSGLEGISVPLLTFDFGGLVAPSGVPTADFFWGLNESAAIDTQIGLRFAKTPADPTANPPTADSTTFGVHLGVGYRMIKANKGKIRPYVEPGIALDTIDVGHVGDNIAIGAFGEMGVEYLISDQLTVGTQFGAAASFTQKFKNIDIATFTGAVDVSFWW